MKNLIIVALTIIASGSYAQNFTADINSAKSSYSAGKLEDAHFSLLQAMQEVDLIIGNEVMKQLPVKMDTYASNPGDDNVTANVGFVGTTIHRSYGPEKNIELSIIGNSPLISTLNAFLSTPLLGGMISDAAIIERFIKNIINLRHWN